MVDKNFASEKLLGRLQDRSTLPEDLHGMQVKTQEYADGYKESAVEIWERPPYQSRLELRSAEVISEFNHEPLVQNVPDFHEKKRRGDLIIKNNNKLIKYNKENNRHRFYTFDSTEESATSVTDPSLLGRHPEANFEIVHEGTERIAGRTTHILTFHPKDNSEPFYTGYDSVQLWIDDEFWLPIKQTAAYQLTEDTLYITSTFEEISFDTGIEEDVFTFDSPDGSDCVQ